MYLLGILSGVVFFVVVITAVYIGYRLGKKGKKQTTELDDETLRKQKRIHEDFQKLMNYDLNTALRRKDVGE